MKKLLFTVFCFTLLLAGCGEQKETLSTNDVKEGEQASQGKTKLDREEQIAVDFYSQLVGGSEEEQEKFLDDFVHSEGREYFEGVAGSGQGRNDSNNVQVIESAKTTYDDGDQGKLVLLTVENEKGDLREVILAFAKEEKEYRLVYSITSESEEEGLETFNKLRKEFKASVPKKLAERKEKEASQKANVEVADQVLYSWKDSINTIWVNYSAEIKNTGDATAHLGSIQVNYIDEAGAVIGTSDMITPVPDTLLPGETAYIGETTIANAADKPEQIVDATVNIDFKKTTDEPTILETENVNFKEVKNGFSGPYIVTGTVKNPHDELVDDVRLAAGLYDNEGKLIGVLKESLQVSLNPDGTAGFEMSYPEISEDIKGKVTEVKVKAYNWYW